MSKVVAVFEKPQHCSDCPCYHQEKEYCQYHKDHTYNRPLENCLKALPEKKTPPYEITKNGSFVQFAKLYEHGWNDCIDSILGEHAGV